jgi:hypothetical protein
VKIALEILKDRPLVSMVLTRDSVCAGDDCDAPHERNIKIHSFTAPDVLAREASTGYLPDVAGIGHSWICALNGVEIAEIKTSAIHPLVGEIILSENNRMHFVYRSAMY